jgi:MSHA biogenesis protein MshP
MHPDREHGFAIIGAFFLVVILALLGLYLSRVTAQNQAGSAIDIQGARAYSAANAGLEWAAAQLLLPASAPGCFAATTITFAGSVLEPFTTAVSCSSTVQTEAGAAITSYRVVANSCNQPVCPQSTPGSGYVERQLELSLARQ